MRQLQRGSMLRPRCHSLVGNYRTPVCVRYNIRFNKSTALWAAFYRQRNPRDISGCNAAHCCLLSSTSAYLQHASCSTRLSCNERRRLPSAAAAVHVHQRVYISDLLTLAHCSSPSKNGCAFVVLSSIYLFTIYLLVLFAPFAARSLRAPDARMRSGAPAAATERQQTSGACSTTTISWRPANVETEKTSVVERGSYVLKSPFRTR